MVDLVFLSGRTVCGVPSRKVGDVFPAVVVVDHVTLTVQLEVAATRRSALSRALTRCTLDFAPDTLMPSSAARSLWVMPSYSLR